MARTRFASPLIDVSYDSGVCQRSGVCLRGMRAAFGVGKSPWRNLALAGTEEAADRVRTIVEQCPSGAARVERYGGEPGLPAD